jgi:biotin carboxyl carrier protein
MIDQQGLDALRTHYRFDEWVNRSRTDESLFIAGYDVRRAALGAGEMSAERIVEAAEPAAPKMTRVFWKPPGEGEDVIVDVQVFECNSRAQAHEYLLQFLGSFQAPELARRDDVPWSDVCFTTRGEGAVLFARGNLVHVIRNAGRRRVRLLGVAAMLDLPLAEAVAAAPQVTAMVEEEQPARSKGKKKRTAKKAAVSDEMRGSVGEPILLPKQARPSVEVRVVTRGGDVVRAGDALMFVPARPGEHDVMFATLGDENTAPGVDRVRVTVT